MKTRTFLTWLALMILLGCKPATRFSSRADMALDAKPQNQLQQAAERWIGVPYRWGGNDRQGIDCSGLAVQLYKEVFHYKLPRNAAKQRVLGYAVRAPYLKAGDLLFFRFKTDEGTEHVGVYLGHGHFIHASQTRGVVIERLSNPYYRRHLIVIRRILR